MRFGLKVVTWITLLFFSIPALAQNQPAPPPPASPVNPYPPPAPAQQQPAPYPYPYPPPQQYPYPYPPPQPYPYPPPQQYPYPYPPPAYNYPPNYYAPPPQQPMPPQQPAPQQEPARPMPDLLTPVERPLPPAQPPRPVRYELRRNWGLFVGGLVLFDITWSISMASGYFSGTPHLYIPAVGPFLIANDLLNQNCARAYNGVITSSYSCNASSGDRAAATALIFDGLGQVAGIAMMLAGALTKSRQPVREQRLTFLPTGLGAAIIGKF